MDEVPFPDLRISSHEFLETLSGRSECPNCGKSRKYYCYTCYVPVKGAETDTPKVKLPFKIDIIKHPSECDGKSTATHAGVLAPDDVKIYTYPCIPDYPDRDRVVLVFPSENSVTLEQLAGVMDSGDTSCTDKRQRYEDSTSEDVVSKTPENDTSLDTSKTPENDTSLDTSKTPENDTSLGVFGKTPYLCDSDTTEDTNNHCDKLNNEQSGNGNTETECMYTKQQNKKRKFESISTESIPCVTPPFDKVVFIDSTWNQTKRIYTDERLKGLKQVELKTRKTKFWRHQRDKPDTYLSTIEAIYYFIRDYHDLFVPRAYDGDYDNLLFFFTFMYKKIRNLYDGGKTLKAYQKETRPHQNLQN